MAEVFQLGVQLVGWLKSYLFILFMNMVVLLMWDAQHRTLDAGHMMCDARLGTLDVGRTRKGRKGHLLYYVSDRFLISLNS